MLKLEECYRCGPEIVDLSSWVISQELDRIPKALSSVTRWGATIELVVTPNEATEERAVAAAIAHAIRKVRSRPRS